MTFVRMKALMFLLGIVLIFTGCGGGEEDATLEGEDELTIVTSLSILADMTENIVGDRADVDYLVPIGEEPEEYEPVPSDFRKISEADVFLVNGYNIETWLEKVMENVSDTKIEYLAEAKDAPTIPLRGTDIPDPHLWLDAELVIDYYIDNIVTTVTELDPQGEDYYKGNSEDYIEELQELDNWIKEQLKEIDESNRYIISSENCYKYYGEAYGFQVDGIWEINAHEEGTPQQISRVVDLVKEEDVPSIFVESTISPQYMETVGEETGVPIHGEIYSDDLGKEGSGASTYINMMRHNTNKFVSGLTP